MSDLSIETENVVCDSLNLPATPQACESYDAATGIAQVFDPATRRIRPARWLGWVFTVVKGPKRVAAVEAAITIENGSSHQHTAFLTSRFQFLD